MSRYATRRYSRRRSAAPGLVLLVRVLQALLGLFFLFSSLTKGIDPMGTGLKIAEYFGLAGIALSPPAADFLAVGLSVFEGLLGAFLLLGVGRRWSPVLALVFMVPMTLLTLYLFVANPVADCGCFGDAVKISNGATFGKNILLLLLLFPVVRLRRSLYRLGPARTQRIAGATAALLLFSFNIYPLNYLPIIDFRPYREGTPISQFVDRPADDGMRYIYVRDGKERAFTTEELSMADSSWTYVRHEEVLPSAAQPKASEADFILLDRDGNEAGHDLAAPDARALLFVVSDLSRVTADELELGLELQRRLASPVTLVMTEDFDRLAQHPERERIERFDRVLFMDLKMAQTLIRSNPGLVVISRGVLLRKLSCLDLRAKVRDPGFLAHIFDTSTSK